MGTSGIVGKGGSAGKGGSGGKKGKVAELIDGEMKKWAEVETRDCTANVLDPFPEAAFRCEKEQVHLDPLFKLLAYTDTRRLRDSHGRLLVDTLSCILRRVQHVADDFGTIYTIWVDIPCERFGLPTRRYSGIMRMATTPPEAVRRHLREELRRSIPRSAMGRSLFGYGRLVRPVFRKPFGLFVV